MLHSPSICLSSPLYEQVHKLLLSRILSGEWEPHVALPGDMALSQELGVSVGTIRKAMDRLTREHFVVRERGRGTFIRQDLASSTGSMFTLRNRSGEPVAPQITISSSSTQMASPAQARTLWPDGMRGTKPRVLKLLREWRLAGSLVCYESIMVDDMRFHDLGREEGLEHQTLFPVYEDRFRVKVDRIRWEIGVPADAIVAPERALQELGQPAVLLRRTACDRRGPFELCEHIVSLADRSFEIIR